MRGSLRDTIASGRLTLVLVIVGVIGGLTAGILTVRAVAGNASDRAGDADRAAECSTLLLLSVAERAIQPRAIELGCDIETAEQIITSGVDRDARVEQLEKQLRDAGLEPLPPMTDSNGDGDMDLGTDPTTAPPEPPTAQETARIGPGATRAPAGGATSSPPPAETQPPPDQRPPPPPPPDDPDDEPPLPILPPEYCTELPNLPGPFDCT